MKRKYFINFFFLIFNNYNNHNHYFLVIVGSLFNFIDFLDGIFQVIVDFFLKNNEKIYVITNK